MIAICAAGPIHIASDSEVFVEGANRLADLIKKGQIVKTPWKLMSDGDLWEHFF